MNSILDVAQFAPRYCPLQNSSYFIHPNCRNKREGGLGKYMHGKYKKLGLEEKIIIYIELT